MRAPREANVNKLKNPARVMLANTFDFLGCAHYCDKSMKENLKVGSNTSRKK